MYKCQVSEMQLFKAVLSGKIGW